AIPFASLLERFRYRFSFSAPSGGLGELGITPARRAALRASASTPAALRVYGSSKNQHDEIFGTSSKSSPWPREPGPTRFWSPRKAGQKRRNKNEKRNRSSEGSRKWETNGVVGGTLKRGCDEAWIYS